MITSLRPAGVALIAAVLLAACGVSGEQVKSDQVDLGHGSAWFLLPADSEAGELAFLVGFDSAKKLGRLFLPPRMLMLSSGADGAGRFRSEMVLHDPRRRFEFQGVFSSQGVSGYLRVVAIDQTQLATWPVTARPFVAPEPSSPKNAPWPIRVSDADFSVEGGEMTGIDLEVFLTQDGPVGVAAFYDAWVADRPEPLLMKNITAVGRDFTFEVRTDRILKFRVTLENGKTARLSHTGDEGLVTRPLSIRNSRLVIR
jgi:hypothetical protein